MADAVEFMKIVKRAAIDAVNVSKPVEICFGKVVSTNPLQVSVDQKLLLDKNQLILSKNVTDFKIEITVNHTTESSLGNHNHNLNGCSGNIEETNLSHCHSYEGKKLFTVHNGLAVGDEVILLRQQGGQKYIVADKIG